MSGKTFEQAARNDIREYLATRWPRGCRLEARRVSFQLCAVSIAYRWTRMYSTQPDEGSTDSENRESPAAFP